MSYRGKEKPIESLPIYNDGQGLEKKRNLFNGKRILLQSIDLEITPQDIQIVGTVFVSWIIIVHLIERTHVKYTYSSCKWKKWEGWDKNSDVHRVAIIADPQLVDGNSYPDRPAIINSLITKLSDNYLHRNYRFLQHSLDPDTIFFLGDLFDGGREWGDTLWFEEYDRFNKVFPKQPNRRVIQSLPGNHDIGFENIDPEKLKRFTAFFGPSNDFMEIGNHSVILLDTISLSSDDSTVKQPSEEFLDSVMSLTTTSFPNILLTHVPLYRINNQQLCGPLRESKKLFPVQKGKQYQTVISPELSSKILSTIKPKLVLSGDDHDYCEISHDLQDGFGHATEITVKAASMTAGIKYPAIQLLSLHNPVDSQGSSINNGPSIKTEMCYLSDPYFEIGLYVTWLIITIIILGFNFLFPQSLEKLIYKIRSKTQDHIALPFFTATSNKNVVINNKGKNIKGFFISVIVTILFAFFTIGVYYRNV